MSKFIYEAMKKEEGRIHVFSTDASRGNAIIQDGFKQFLFCNECEQLRSRWETYFSNKLNGGELRGNTNPYKVIGLDYDKFKLFLLSTLFVASISDHPFFENIRLESSSEETLRQMLLTQNPGEPHEFGCSIFAIEEEQTEDDCMVMNPQTVQDKGCSIHRFVFSGFLFAFIEHAERGITRDLMDTFLTKEGTVLIRKRRLTELRFIMNALGNLDRQGKLELDGS